MLRELNQTLTNFHKVFDILLVILSFIAAYQIKRNYIFKSFTIGLSTEPNYYLVLLIAVLLAPFFFQLAGFYKSYRTQTIQQLTIRIGKGVVGVLGGLVVCLFFAHELGVSRLLLVLFCMILMGLLLLSKSVLYLTLQYYRAKKYNTRNILIIGTGFRAKRMIQSLQRQKGSGYDILGCLTAESGVAASLKSTIEGVTILGAIPLLPTLLIEQVVDEIIFAADLGNIEFINEYIQFSEELGVSIHIVPDFHLEKIMYRPGAASVFMQEFVGMSTIAISSVPQRHGELIIKNCMDYFLAATGVFLLSPLFLIFAIIIKSTSKGAPFFTQERCGFNGRIFKVIKFRTMVDNAEELQNELRTDNEVDGPVFKITNDPRITSFGKFLRKSSMDELPQLINILMGHMSLVGPRPPLPTEVMQYEPWQRRRLSMKPGITCIWQVSGRNNVGFDQWMHFDLEYIDNWSLLLDIKILLKTVGVVASCTGK